MAENEYPLRLPLVDGEDENRKVIGTAEIDGQGKVMMTVTDEEYKRALQPPPFSLSLPGQPEKTLNEFIQEGLEKAAEAGHQAVMAELERNIQPPWGFIGLAGLTREVLEADAEDHIIRGTD